MQTQTISVQGNRITCVDGRWWEIQSDPRTAPKVGSANDGAGVRRRVRAIAGGVRGYAPRVVNFEMTASVYLAWLMASEMDGA